MHAVSALLAAVLWVQSLLIVTALHVVSTPVAHVDFPALPHEDFEQLFVVTAITTTGAQDFYEETLTSIVARANCQIYISYVPSTAQEPERLATVRVLGSSEQLLQHAVLIHAPLETLGELRVSQGDYTHKTVDLDGFVRVEIQVHSSRSGQLRQIKVSGSGDVIVESKELFAVPQLQQPQQEWPMGPLDVMTLSLSGTGDLYLPPQLELLALTLQIRVSGSGSAFISASALSVDTLDVNLSGSGDAQISIAGELNATTAVYVNTHGAGSLQLSATEIQAPLLDIQVTGSGDTVVGSSRGGSPQSSIDHCALRVSGVGRLDAGGVVCSHASVISSGRGNAIVQVTDSLMGRVSGNASILYVGAAPQSIQSTGRSKRSVVEPLSGPYTPLDVVWHAPPPRETTRASIHTVAAIGESQSEEENETENESDTERDETAEQSPTEADPDDKPSTTTTLSSAQSWLWIIVGIAVAYGVWNWLQSWQRRRDLSRERAPLLSQDSPVYI